MTKLKAALIGYGHWGQNLTRCLQQSPDFELLALADPKFAQSEALDGTLCFQSLEELLKGAKEIDVIIISTPISDQAQLVELALENDKHVLVTKTLALCSKKARELCDLAKQNDLALFVDYTFLYTGGIEAIKTHFSSKPLDRPQFVDMRRKALGKFTKDLTPLWDLACHDLSILFYLFDKSQLKSIQAHSLTQHHKLDAHMQLIVEFDSFKARIDVAWDYPYKKREIEFLGGEHNLFYQDCYPNEKISSLSPGHHYTDQDGFNYSSLKEKKWSFETYEPLPQMLNAFKEKVHSQDKNPPSLYQKVIQALEKAHESLEQDSQKVYFSP